MNINDFFIPIFVIIVMIAIFIFLKTKIKRNTDSKVVEEFQSVSPTETALIDLNEKHDLQNYQINIGDNLFIGFGSTIESDTQIDLLKQAKIDFSDKMRDIYPNKNSIIIKPESYFDENNNKIINSKVGNICLGSPKYTGQELIDKVSAVPIDEKDNYSNCINYDTLNSFDITKNPIPYFKNRAGNQVYYNDDQPLVSHSELCFRDVTAGEDKCITSDDIDMINGKYAVKLKMEDDDGNYVNLKPYNIEYGYHESFGGVVTTPHFMLTNQFNDVREKVEATSTEGCFSSEGRTNHIVYDDSTYGEHYYLLPDPRPLSYYSHIHQHTDG